MSDENNIHTNLEEHKDTPLEARPEEPQQMAESESPETEAQRQEVAENLLVLQRQFDEQLFLSY